jgi:hypothetical protein
MLPSRQNMQKKKTVLLILGQKNVKEPPTKHHLAVPFLCL